MSDKIKELLAKDSFDINDLADIVVILRSENGCPWDKVQTHKSIKKDFLEEVYEVMEAIDCDSPEMMRRRTWRRSFAGGFPYSYRDRKQQFQT